MSSLENKNKGTLEVLRATIPFLRQIPDNIYYHLDTTELFIPFGEVARRRVMLEGELGQYIMTYRRDQFNLAVPIEAHLCANLQGSDLSTDQLEILQTFERQLGKYNVSFVAYKKPLSLIEPFESPIYGFYKQIR